MACILLIVTPNQGYNTDGLAGLNGSKPSGGRKELCGLTPFSRTAQCVSSFALPALACQGVIAVEL